MKLGKNKQVVENRRAAFVEHFLTHGNAQEAARAAGYSGKTAHVQGPRLLKDPRVAELIAKRQAEMNEALRERQEVATEKLGLSVERTLQELARLAYVDPRKLFNPDGTAKPVAELDDDTAAALAGLDVFEKLNSNGEVVAGITKKYRVANKTEALVAAMKFHGLFLADNAQRAAQSQREPLGLVETGRVICFAFCKTIADARDARVAQLLPMPPKALPAPQESV